MRRTSSSGMPRSSSRPTILRNESVGSGFDIWPRSEPSVECSAPIASIHCTSVSTSQLWNVDASSYMQSECSIMAPSSTHLRASS